MSDRPTKCSILRGAVVRPRMMLLEPLPLQREGQGRVRLGELLSEQFNRTYPRYPLPQPLPLKGEGRDRAFTLIELILVMVLMLILLAIAAPRLDAFSRGRVIDAQANMLLARLNAARDRAAMRATPCRVEFDDQTHSVRTTEQIGGTFEPIDDPEGHASTLPSEITVKIEELSGTPSVNNWVGFSPTGEADPVAVRLDNGVGDVLYIVARTPLEPLAIVSTPEAATP
ncbi:MAG: type II secretion system protein GspH [Phycisphaera sp.]|nr:type II secretion system protein GspH [Phycisphaera sp.]